MCFFLLGSALWAAVALASSQPTRVLFIGNSLTAVNNVPVLVQRIAAANGDRFECESVLFGDHGLVEHWDRPEARRAIAKGGWTFVVLQQGPSALAESRSLLIDYGQRFDREIRRVSGRTAFFMVWPSRQRFGDFDGVSRSYRAAAEATGGLILPAGDAWRALWRRDSKQGLYGDDGFHPSALGSYLASLVIYQGLSGRTASELPPLVPMSDDSRKLLLAAAAEVTAGQ